MLIVQVHKRRGDFLLEASFQLEKEITVLFGPSGSGKTTLLHLIAGILTPDGGEIRLDDLVYFSEGRPPLPIRKRKVGVLFQDYALFPHMTVERNILYGVKGEKKIEAPQIRQLLEVTGIVHLIHKYPHQLSGGEKQRVALVRALAADSKLLLLDEPFSALDRKTKEECHDELLRLHALRRIPILLVTHDMEEAKKLGKRLMYMEQGKVRDIRGASYAE
ncbi:ATP-binding cassette domain-containing protein [Thermicanus aegyptius]|uniref:ATP-binding cassette domain-containing protein n=1 Tax=Thermicanus aegyptius TaxID=94009 RepID=UPI0003FCDB58|nr:ATP-binding cassette domain-containing protein [Thermicanus aegyptius]